jgi:hypothetical protein
MDEARTKQPRRRRRADGEVAYPDGEGADRDGVEADPVHSTTASTTGSEEDEEEDRRLPESLRRSRSGAAPKQIPPRGTETKPAGHQLRLAVLPAHHTAAGLSRDLGGEGMETQNGGAGKDDIL